MDYSLCSATFWLLQKRGRQLVLLLTRATHTETFCSVSIICAELWYLSKNLRPVIRGLPVIRDGTLYISYHNQDINCS